MQIKSLNTYLSEAWQGCPKNGRLGNRFRSSRPGFSRAKSNNSILWMVDKCDQTATSYFREPRDILTCFEISFSLSSSSATTRIFTRLPSNIWNFPKLGGGATDPKLPASCPPPYLLPPPTSCSRQLQILNPLLPAPGCYPHLISPDLLFTNISSCFIF